MAFVYDTLAVLALWIVGTAALLPFSHGDAISPQNHVYKLYLLLIVYFFFTEFWHRGGQTIGMMAWKYRVVDQTGHAITRKQAMIRFFTSIVSILCAGVGFLWQWLPTQKRSWSDIAANTQVIRTFPQ